MATNPYVQSSDGEGNAVWFNLDTGESGTGQAPEWADPALGTYRYDPSAGEVGSLLFDINTNTDPLAGFVTPLSTRAQDFVRSSGGSQYSLEQAMANPYAQAGLLDGFGRIDDVYNMAESLGLSPEEAIRLYDEGMGYLGTSFGGATDQMNKNLRSGLAIENMLRATGQLTPEMQEALAQYVDYGYQEMNQYRSQEGEKEALGQFVGMLGGLAFSPMAFGGSEWLGSMGGKLAGAGASALGAVAGGGNPLLALAGNFLPIGMDLSGVSGLLADINPIVKSIGENAVGQLVKTGSLDPKSLALGAAGAGLDWGWNELGGIEGMFGEGTEIADSISGDETFVPTSYTTGDGLSLSGEDGFMKVANTMDRGDYGDFDAATMASDIVPRQEAAASDWLGSVTNNLAPSISGEEMFVPPKEEAPAPTAEQPPIAESISGEETFVEEPQKEKTPFSSLKPSTILKMAVGLAGLLGNDADGDEARAVYEAEYANDEARRQAYLDYANRIFASIPGIADAYSPDAYREIGQFGTVEIDPETGEARFVPNAEGQSSLDSLIGAADKVIDQILDTDTSKLSAEEFEKAITELQGKRDADFAKLMRVLYARGMLGLATYGEAFENPFTGRTESYQLEDGQAANPYMASYLSGIERENAELAGKSMNSAEDFVDQLLSQSTDLTNQLGARSGNMLDAILGARGRYGDITAAGQSRGNALAQLLQSPAGMFGGNAAAALAAEDYMSEEERRRLLAMLEGGN
jgi:hypothetical protein